MIMLTCGCAMKGFSLAQQASAELGKSCYFCVFGSFLGDGLDVVGCKMTKLFIIHNVFTDGCHQIVDSGVEFSPHILANDIQV